MNTTDRTFQEIVDSMIDAIRQMAMTDSDKIRLVSGLAFLQTRYELDTKREEKVDLSLYDVEEIHENCTVQIWKNSATGDVSIGWWENEEEE